LKNTHTEKIYLHAVVIILIAGLLLPSYAINTQAVSDQLGNPQPLDHLTSTNQSATLGKRLLRTDADTNLHLLYRSNGFLYYTFSSDKGQTWKNEELIPLPPSSSPQPSYVFEEGFTLAIDTANRPHVVFVRRTPTHYQDIYIYEVWHTQRTQNGHWNTPQLLYRDQCYYLGYIQLEIDTNNYGHVCFTHVRNGYLYTHYFRFNSQTNEVISSSHKYFTDAFTFDMALDQTGTPHVVYWYRGYYDIRVVYQTWTLGADHWSGPLTVAYGGDEFFNNAPKITVGADNIVHIIWANQDAWFNINCWYRTRSQGVWGNVEQATQNAGGQQSLVLVNNQPCIIMNDFIQNDELFDYEIFYALRGQNGWLGGRENISASPDSRSLHPHAVVIGNTLYTCWTEGNQAPYSLAFDHRIPHPIAP
jgi:hypothetical protein